MKTIEIITPKGAETIKNPLYEYTFHPIDPSFDSYFAHDPTTVRNPNPADSKESQPQALIEYVALPFYLQHIMTTYISAH